MHDIVVPKLYQKMNSDNYFVNCYKYLIRSKSIHFLFILIEMLLNIIQELETFIKGFNIKNNQQKFYYNSYITEQFEKLSIEIKIIILILLIAISNSVYIILTKINMKKKMIIISILSNVLELFYFRTIMLIFLNIFFTLPNIIFLLSLVILIYHIYLIVNNFLYNHLYYFVPKFINYPFDEFSSLFDIICLFSKIILSISSNTSISSMGKFAFIILFFCQIFFTFYFIYLLRYRSYLFMKNTFLNKTKLIFFFSNTIILFIAILFGKDEIITVLFLILFIGLFFIIMVYMYLMYNPFHFIRINRDSPIENIFFYLFTLSEENDIEFLIENKINEHFEKCGLCTLCKNYKKYLEIYDNIDEKEDEEKERLISGNNEYNKDDAVNNKNNKLYMDLFDVIYDGKNKYFELIRKIALNYKNKGRESFNNNNSYYYINISFLIYSDYQKNNITLSLNEKILLEEFNKENKLLDNHESQIKQILFCNNFINLGNKILTQLKDILKCEQNRIKAKKLIELSLLLKEMKALKYKSHLFSHKQENISNSGNLIMACSILYEEIFNTTLNSSQLPIRENIQPLEDIFHNNSNKIDKIISLAINLTNNNCKIIRVGKDLFSYKNNNLFDLFPLIFKEYQIKLFLTSILNNFDINLKKDMNNPIKNKDINKGLKEHKKSLKPIKTGNSNKKKREYVEIKVIICENIASKIYYRLLTLKLAPLFNNDYNSYFILFDGVFYLLKNTLITLQDFEEGNNPKEKILSASDQESEKIPEIYSMAFQKYVAWQNNKGFVISQITKFNLSTKLYTIYSIIPRDKDLMKKKIKRVNYLSKTNTQIEEELEDEVENDKKLFHKNTKIEKLIEDTASVASQQTGSSYSNGISSIGIKTKKKDDIHEYNSLGKIRKVIYLSIPFILIVLILQFINLKSLEKDIYNNNHSYIQFREFYSLYFQLFTSILGLTCIVKTDTDCKSLVSIYSEQYNNKEEEDEYFDFYLFIRVQTQILAAEIMSKRNNLVNIHRNIGNKKYNELFGQIVEYLRVSQKLVNGNINFGLNHINIEFSEAILIICNSFQVMCNNTSKDIIYFLNKIDDPFLYLNNYPNVELTQFQKEIYEMILNYKIYREQFNIINEKLFDILVSKSNYIILYAYIDITFDTILMLFISSLLYAYLLFFENILMKILNYINMTINLKNENFNFSQMFSEKIDNLETILQIYNGDPVKAVQKLNNIYSDYQQYLITKNKNNLAELNKKGYKKIPNNENKKDEMNNIPKNQRIVTKKDIRNFHIIYNYLLLFSLILISFIGSYIGMMYMWEKHSNRAKNLYMLFNKDYTLESSIYKSINIYDIMIFHNYTIDELSQYIFKDSNIDIKEKNYLLKSFYEDLQYAFNNKKEKNKLNNIFMDFENQSNFTCKALYDFCSHKLNDLQRNSEIKRINNIKEYLIKICNKTRVDESNDIISTFEYHFQYIKNGIISINDFSYEQLISHINNGILGKITIFFNHVIIFVLDITTNDPHIISKEKIR